MEAKTAINLSLTLALILLYATIVVSFDITKILREHDDFSIFNSYLIQTGLAANINNQQTITVLVVDNGAMGYITSKAQELAQKILAIHVLLDYYEPKMLASLPNKESPLTTLLQTTGSAVGEQGFIKVTDSSDGGVTLGSSVKGAPHSSKVVRAVMSQPYNISVIQISQPIMTPGLDQISPTQSPKASTFPESPNNAQDHNAEAPSEDQDKEMEASSPAQSNGHDGEMGNLSPGGDNDHDEEMGALSPGGNDRDVEIGVPSPAAGNGYDGEMKGPSLATGNGNGEMEAPSPSTNNAGDEGPSSAANQGGDEKDKEDHKKSATTSMSIVHDGHVMFSVVSLMGLVLLSLVF